MAENKSQGILIFAAVLVVAGLGAGIVYLVLHPRAPFPAVPKSEQSQVSPSIDINVYVDGSESIWHFLNTHPGSTSVESGKTNYLRHFLDHLETTLNPQTGAKGAAWSQANIRGWKFGEFDNGHGKQSTAAVLPLNGGPGKLTEAPKAEFNASRTPIEVAVKDEPKQENPAELRIIVTDLYQTDYRVGEYEKPLADKYLADDDHAVEIFAIRNPFDGDLEDLPGAGKKTLSNAADTMPFYVIVAGLTPDVLRARQALLSTPDDGVAEAVKDHQAIEMLFAKEAGEVSPTKPTIEVPSRKKRGDDSSGDKWEEKTSDSKASYVMVGKESVDDQPDITLVTLRQSGKFRVKWDRPTLDSSPGHVDTTGRSAVTAGPDSPAVKSNLSLEFHAYRSVKKNQAKGAATDKGAKDKADRYERQEFPGAAAAVTLSCGSDNLFPCAVVDNSRLPKGRYLFRFDVIATNPELRSPVSVFGSRSDLMRQWNVEKDVAEGIATSSRPVFPAVASIAGSSHPGMTPQLAAFLQALQATVFNSPVHIVSYYLYVEAK